MDMNVVTTEAWDQSARWGFVQKVYLGVLVQLIFTIIPAYSVIGVDILPAVNQLYGLIPGGISLIVLLCFRYIYKLRHKVPYNYICMVIYTIAVTSLLCLLSSDIQMKKILIGTAIAQLFCALILLLALLGLWRITTLSLYLMLGIGVVVIIILFALYAVLRNIVFLLLAYCCGTLLSSFQLLFDNQLTVATNSKYAFNEYLLAAMNVYSDIMQLVYFLSMMVDTAFKISAKKKKQIV